MSAPVRPSAITPPRVPSLARLEPRPEKQRDGEGRAGVQHRRGDVHVKEQRRAEPDRETRGQTGSCEARGHRERQDERGQAVDRGSVSDGGDVRMAEAVRRSAGRERREMSRGVERRPQHRAADGREVESAPGFVRPLEKGLVERRRFHLAAVVEVLVFVLEVCVAVEVPRVKPGERLHFIGGVDAGRDGRQREDERDDERHPGRSERQRHVTF